MRCVAQRIKINNCQWQLLNNLARSRLQKSGGKARRGFSTSSKAGAASAAPPLFLPVLHPAGVNHRRLGIHCLPGGLLFFILPHSLSPQCQYSPTSDLSSGNFPLSMEFMDFLLNPFPMVAKKMCCCIMAEHKKY